MTLAQKKSDPAAIVAAHQRRDILSEQLNSIERAARQLIRRYDQPIREGKRVTRHPLNAGGTSAIAAVERVRTAVTAGDARGAAEAAIAATLALWQADAAMSEAGAKGQGLVPWRGLLIDATPTEGRILKLTALRPVVELPGDDDAEGWRRMFGVASPGSLRVVLCRLNRKLRAMRCVETFRIRGDTLVLDATSKNQRALR